MKKSGIARERVLMWLNVVERNGGTIAASVAERYAMELVLVSCWAIKNTGMMRRLPSMLGISLRAMVVGMKKVNMLSMMSKRGLK